MEQTAIAAVSAPLIVGVVQVFKPLIPDARLYAVLALALGIVANVGIAYARNGDLIEAAIAGTLAGLSAAGLYSGVKEAAAPA